MIMDGGGRIAKMTIYEEEDYDVNYAQAGVSVYFTLTAKENNLWQIFH